ncbi:IniB N-terminal domain-containing protein [Lentzea albidocapillata]|uniref:Uncharacterized protein n=1 Tax=Lentzea albidocapillata TaxID=40571 RepID=A0A1W2F561_9PSEU|nr:IniB N-terminal domain-containing protein [Lentzea albidocapillata]SMD17024.1 hypothetical protein SAMN05660733_05028 [Lentzea albidocapillata]
MQQTETTTVQTGPTTAQTGDTSVQTGGTEAQTEQTTLHDFTLGLLTDLDAREAFQQDPLAALEAAGLGDLTPGDVQDILPLVLDAASVPNTGAIDEVLSGCGELPAVDQLTLIASNVEGITGTTGVSAPSAITALTGDFSGLGDVSGTLDSTVLTAGDVVSNVSGVAHDNAVVSKVTDVVDVDNVTDVVVKDLDTDVLVKDVLDSDVLVKDVAGSVDLDVKDVVDVTDNVVHNVVQVGDVHNDLGQVVGDVKIGDIDILDGGIGNGNGIDLHL